MYCGRSPDGRAAESSAKERRASVSEGAAAEETSAIGRRSFLLAIFLCARWQITVSHLLGDFLGVGSLWFIRRAEQALQSWPSFRQGHWIQVPVSVSEEFAVPAGGFLGPSSHSSHIRHLSLEDRLLF